MKMMEKCKDRFKDRLGDFFEKTALDATGRCVYLIWGDEAPMPQHLLEQCMESDK